MLFPEPGGFLMAARTAPTDPPEWAEGEARRILARAHIRAKQEGRTAWDAAKREIAEHLAAHSAEDR